MSQPVGSQYKSRIPSLGDDSSIEEALRVYHYGVDNYSSQPIPDDSIEGNFRKLDIRLTSAEGTLSGLGNIYIEQISQSASANTITAQTTTTVPLTIRAIASQTSNLQEWKNSSATNIATLSTAGTITLAGYAAVGSTTVPTTTALTISIANPAHKGVTIRASGSQTNRIQEWQDSSGNPISWVDERGVIFSSGDEVGSGTGSFFLIGC